MSEQDDGFVKCVHCGVSYNIVPFKLVPTSSCSALVIACEKCFRELPPEEVATPKLHDYLAWARSQMPAYRASALFMRGVTSVTPVWYLAYFRGVSTDDPPGPTAKETL
ncbi:MAG: hypothetical protein AAB869_03980 [Patescibacteria group bacterium]